MFNCEKCAFTFTRKDSLLRHVKTHDGYQIVCNICSKKCSRKDILNRHMKNIHGMFILFIFNKIIFNLIFILQAIDCVQHNIEITPNKSDEPNDGYDDMCVKISDNAEGAGLCNVTSNIYFFLFNFNNCLGNARAPTYHDIEIAPQICVLDIPAGPSNQNAKPSNEKMNKLVPEDGDDLCMAAMDEFENTHTGQG